MKDSDAAEFCAIWLQTASLYSQMDYPKDTLRMVFRLFREFDLADVKKAIEKHVKTPVTGRFMPKPADIIGYLQKTSENEALGAWSKLLSAVQKIGTYKSVVFDDSITMSVIRDMGGWCHLGKTNERNLPFVQKEFVNRYLDYIREPPKTYPNKLLGIHDSTNLGCGQKLSQPTLIGCAKKAKFILENPTEKEFEKLNSQKKSNVLKLNSDVEPEFRKLSSFEALKLQREILENNSEAGILPKKRLRLLKTNQKEEHKMYNKSVQDLLDVLFNEGFISSNEIENAFSCIHNLIDSIGRGMNKHRSKRAAHILISTSRKVLDSLKIDSNCLDRLYSNFNVKSISK